MKNANWPNKYRVIFYREFYFFGQKNFFDQISKVSFREKFWCLAKIYIFKEKILYLNLISLYFNFLTKIISDQKFFDLLCEKIWKNQVWQNWFFLRNQLFGRVNFFLGKRKMSAYHLYLSKLLIIWPQKALESSKAAAHVDEPYAFQCLINSVRTGVKMVERSENLIKTLIEKKNKKVFGY